MSRLICFDLAEGRKLEIKGVSYRVRTNPLARLTVSLERESDGKLLKISKNELATLVVIEEAVLVDDLDEPEPSTPNKGRHRPLRVATDLSRLPIHRMLDWHAKMFILIRLMPFQHASPKGKLFNGLVRDALEELAAWRTAIGWLGGKTWSPLTLYHDLLRWRKSRYSVAALQKKGVQYCPWEKKPSLYEAAAKLVKEIGLDGAHLSAASVHEAVNKRLSCAAATE